MFGGFCNFGNWGAFANFGPWGWAAMILQMVFWIGLIAGIGYLLVRATRHDNMAANSVSGSAVTGLPTAKEILQTRYASGEINREQYLQMLSDLS